MPYTNNISERHFRPSVIFRKVTNGFRCEWGAETYAAFRSVVSTAKANGASVLDTVRLALAAKLFVEPTGSRRATPTNLFQHRAGHLRSSGRSGIRRATCVGFCNCN